MIGLIAGSQISFLLGASNTVAEGGVVMLEEAGVNTLLGMGMAFTVLMLISLIISLFPILTGANRKKEVKPASVAKEVTPAPVVEEEEEDLSDDAELVAVIAAAIAAYEKTAPVEGFQVRSIRKRRNIRR